MSRILHVVVGSGIPGYFSNAINSVLALTTDDVLGIYNYLDDEDFARASESFHGLNGDRLTMALRPNLKRSLTKTGSLYLAYNEAIDSARNKYDYLHFIQADMQLMHWDPETFEEIEVLFQRSGKNGAAPAVCISTVFECKGKWTDQYYLANLIYSPALRTHVYRGVSMSDVGVFSMRVINELNLRFGGHEVDMQGSLARLGFEMPKLRAPISAFVPWPVTVRNGKLKGLRRLKNYAQPPLLKMREGYPMSDYSKNVWMEDWVYPNGWKTLHPFWPTDTVSRKWVGRRQERIKQSGQNFWATIDGAGVVRDSVFPGRRMTPGLFELLAAVSRSYLTDSAQAVLSSLRYRFRMLTTTVSQTVKSLKD